MDGRQLLWFAVTRNPSAEWLAQQMAEAFPWNTAPTYLVREGFAVTTSYPDVRRHHHHANSFRTAPSLCADMIFGKDRGSYSCHPILCGSLLSAGASLAAPIGGIRQHEQVQAGEHEQDQRNLIFGTHISF